MLDLSVGHLDLLVLSIVEGSQVVCASLSFFFFMFSLSFGQLEHKLGLIKTVTVPLSDCRYVLIG